MFNLSQGEVMKTVFLLLSSSVVLSIILYVARGFWRSSINTESRKTTKLLSLLSIFSTLAFVFLIGSLAWKVLIR
jgi:hypothetical protein